MINIIARNANTNIARLSLAAINFYTGRKMNPPLRGRFNFDKSFQHTPFNELYQLYLNVLSMLKARGYLIPSIYVSSSLGMVPQYRGMTGEMWLKSIVWENFEKEYQRKYTFFIEYFNTIAMQQGSPTFPFSSGHQQGFRMAMSGVYAHSTDPLMKILVRFISPNSKDSGVSDTQINNVVHVDAPNFGVQEIILITSHNLQKKAASLVPRNMTVLFDEDLKIDPEDSICSSHFRKMSEEEKMIFYEKNKVEPRNMPKQLKDDPVTIKYGWKAGDLIEIERVNAFTNGVCTTSKFWRVVTNDVNPRR